jgi:hypothetical protein
MTDQKTTIVGNETKRTTVSDEIAGAVRQANEKIDRLDTDPIIRLALARVAIRSFAHEIVANYPEQSGLLAAEFEAVAAKMRTTDPADLARDEDTEDAIIDPVLAEGETDAEDRQSASESRGRGQADPEGGQPGSTGRKGSRNNGSQRVGKEHAILRVGGA